MVSGAYIFMKDLGHVRILRMRLSKKGEGKYIPNITRLCQIENEVRSKRPSVYELYWCKQAITHTSTITRCVMH